MANITMIFDRRIYIIPTDPDSDIMPHCPDNSNTTRCATLIDLIVNGASAIQFGEEIMFRSGLHIVHEINAYTLSLKITGLSLTMRGESNNVTILCLEQFFFEFIESSNINIIFRNCGAYSSNNYTLVFNKHRGNVLLDHIKREHRWCWNKCESKGINMYLG